MNMDELKPILKIAAFFYNECVHEVNCLWTVDAECNCGAIELESALTPKNIDLIRAVINEKI